jgi:transposase
MPIVEGLDIHRKQLTFDYVDTDTGELQRGQVAPADRAHLAGWLARRFAGRRDVEFALEGVPAGGMWLRSSRRPGRRACR